MSSYRIITELDQLEKLAAKYPYAAVLDHEDRIAVLSDPFTVPFTRLYGGEVGHVTLEDLIPCVFLRIAGPSVALRDYIDGQATP